MPHAVEDDDAPAIPPYTPICMPARTGAPPIAAATAASASASASGIVYAAPTDEELVVNQN